MSDVKIFVSHRIDLDAEIISNDVFVPVRCGAVYDKTENTGIIGDNTGDNISEKRNSFCELTVQYWAWKNVEADYYGLCHYRRLFSFSDKYVPDTNIYNHIEEDKLTIDLQKKYMMTSEHIRKLVSNNDIITIFPMRLPQNESVYNSITSNKRTYDKVAVDLFIDTIKSMYPYLSNYVDSYMNGSEWLAWNCYILKKEYFFDYSEKLFNLLFEYEKRLDTTNYNIEQIRMIGYMAEIFFPIYYSYTKNIKNIATKQLQLIEIKNINRKREILPINGKNTVSIAMASSNEYVPFLSVVLTSIKENIDKNRTYEINILENKITKENKRILKEEFCDDNIYIRFIDVSNYLMTYHLYTRDHVTAMTYSRLALLDIFSKHEKMIYVDCDLVVNKDLGILYDTKLNSEYIAGCMDTVMAGWENSLDEYKNYSKELGLDNHFLYFNAGVILVNLEEFRKDYTSKKLFDIASSRKWKWFDQDVLNKVCAGKVKYLDNNWNYMSHKFNNELELPEYYMPANLYLKYKEAKRNPYIIHYPGKCIPCFVPEVELAHIFWKYARKSCFYELILLKLIEDRTGGYLSWYINNYINPRTIIKIKNVVKRFCPAGTKRHEIAKKIYSKFRGW